MNIDLLQVPYDSGRRAYRMGRGPLRLIEEGLPAQLAVRGHLVRLVPLELALAGVSELDAAFELAIAVRTGVAEARARHAFPLVLAGNCSASLGALAALPEPRVFWFDAHGDLNTPETSLSGFLDGMALATALGLCWTEQRAQAGLTVIPETRVWLLGARDLDPGEREYLEHSSLHTSLENLPERKESSPAHLHIDLDVLDPTVACANQFAAPAGLSLAQLLDAVERIARTYPIASATFSAYDPEADPEGAMIDVVLALAARIASLAL